MSTFLTVFIWVIALIIMSFFLRHLITSLIHKGPDLGAFKSVRGNFTALLMGLAVAWIFGGFCEEIFFRGFLMNVIYKILPGSDRNSRVKWGLALVITSILTGFGHSYQGITGMILTGIIALCFGSIYLTNNRNLWPGILTHGIYDSIAFILVFSGFSLDSLIKF
ncbi:MAG: CPBP family intramembrane glutamic endopeptidase [Bacteroidales bacterium]